MSSSDPLRAMFSFIFDSFSFLNIGSISFIRLLISETGAHKINSFSPELIISVICVLMFVRPLIVPEMSCFFISSSFEEWSVSSSSYSLVSLMFERVDIFSFMLSLVFFFSFSITIVGFTAKYFTGFPIFCIAKPCFSSDSKTSYVLDLGTPEISAISPADATPFVSNANHTFVS